MPAIGRMRRRYAKQLMGRIKDGGSMVSDVERQQMQQDIQGGAQAALNAQQAQLGQAARAQTGGGGIQEGVFRRSQEDLARQQGDAAVRASGQQRALEAQLTDQRTGAALELAGELHDINRQNAAAAGSALMSLLGTEATTTYDAMGRPVKQASKPGLIGDVFGSALSFAAPF